MDSQTYARNTIAVIAANDPARRVDPTLKAIKVTIPEGITAANGQYTVEQIAALYAAAVAAIAATKGE